MRELEYNTRNFSEQRITRAFLLNCTIAREISRKFLNVWDFKLLSLQIATGEANFIACEIQ